MIIDFELLESPDLPDDFFDESLKDIARDEGKVLFMPGINEQSDDKLSSLVSFDFESKTIVTGYKYPQDQAYDIINDMNPTKVVFDWTRKYFGGRPVEFPNVPQFKPIIPPSRFSSNVGMDAFELKMLGRGFRFLKPTRGQWIKYEKHCVEEVEEDFLIYPTEEQIMRGVLNGIGFEEQSKCSIQVEFVKSVFEPENRKYCDLRSKVKNSFKSLVKLVDVPIYYRQCGVPVVVNIGKRSQFERKVKSEKYVVTVLPKHMVVRCLKSKEQIFKDRKIKYERPKYSDTRYYTRYFSQFKEETNALVVGLDFNPFSPYALDVLTSVKMCDTGVEYSRQYKGEEFYGFFKYKLKRYHSDVWFSSIFTEHTPYTRDLIYNDLAVNQYRAEKVLMLNECFTMLGAPLIIEPFAVNKNYSNSKRSMLRYRVSDIGVVTHVPYMTSSIKVSDEYITNFEVVKWDKPIEIVYRNGKSDRYSMYPQKNEKTIDDFFRWFKNIRKAGIEGVEDYDYVMQQYKKWFVLETYEYINNGSVKVKGVEPLVNKNTGVTVPKYMIWKVKEPEDRGDVIKCFFVPYCIRRYPHNNLGTIIGDLTHLTLEEAVSDITLVKELVKDPPWLFGALKLPSFQNDYKLERVDDDDIEVD